MLHDRIVGAFQLLRNACIAGFFLSLALIVTGEGFLKTNVSTVVGLLYDKSDPRRDAGFTISGPFTSRWATPLPCSPIAWWIGSFLASNFISGLIAQLTNVDRIAGEMADPQAAMVNYREIYELLGLYALAVAAVLLLLTPLLKKLMHLDKIVESGAYSHSVSAPVQDSGS